MSTRQAEGWGDFTHTTQTNSVAATELLERYRIFKACLAAIPRKELVKRRWLQSEDDSSSLATIFFDLPLSRQGTLFRKSSEADENKLALWQARARAEAEYLCIITTPPAFSGIPKGLLHDLARLSVDPAAVRHLPALLAGHGILLVYVHALPGMKADGAVFRLSTGHPVVAMSLRLPRLDYFWFTLLHELAHLVLHLDQIKDPLFFDVEAPEKGLIEKAANRLAKDSMVDRGSWRNCEPKYDPSDRAVRGCAAEHGIHPALVAGLLRRETGNYQRYSGIINELDVRTILFPS